MKLWNVKISSTLISRIKNHKYPYRKTLPPKIYTEAINEKPECPNAILYSQATEKITELETQITGLLEIQKRLTQFKDTIANLDVCIEVTCRIKKLFGYYILTEYKMGMTLEEAKNAVLAKYPKAVEVTAVQVVNWSDIQNLLDTF